MYRLRGDRPVVHILKSLGHLHCIISFAHVDNSNAHTSEVVDLMARSASIKQSDNMNVLSKGERLHGMFGGIKTLEHFIFIPKDEPVT